tara:strand:+ start:219 stop:932 length:714 start_codon:yes stop_codon:yes gene_type:complete
MANINDEIVIKKNVVGGIEWPHMITENTFDKKTSIEIDKAFEDWENNRHISKKPSERWANNIVSYTSIMFFPDCSRWKDCVSELWKENKYSPEYNKNSKDYLVVLELSILKDNREYPFHVDVQRKQMTGVCYWGKGQDGTIIKSGNQMAEIAFKHNRCLWFSNTSEEMWREDVEKKENKIMPWHRYRNTSNKPRYTVNINYTPQPSINSFLDKKNSQLIYWLENKKPLWTPLQFKGK